MSKKTQESEYTPTQPKTVQDWNEVTTDKPRRARKNLDTKAKNLDGDTSSEDETDLDEKVEPKSDPDQASQEC